jgi:hypothetical protein
MRLAGYTTPAVRGLLVRRHWLTIVGFPTGNRPPRISRLGGGERLRGETDSST